MISRIACAITLLLSLAACGEPSAMKTDVKEIPKTHETLTLGGGCFWCVEAVFQQLPGVSSAISGYMGGHVKNPTYEQISGGKTGHIEVVKITFDPEVISAEKLFGWFWNAHDPTTLNRQGNDAGPQYASAIFHHTDAQKTAAKASIQSFQKEFKDPIVTVLRPAETFYPAEEYHQDYYRLNKSKNPYCRVVITPKLKKLKLNE